MLDLQIPYWALTTCGGALLGVASVLLLGYWLNRRKRNQMLGELGKLAVEFGAPEEDASDDNQLN